MSASLIFRVSAGFVGPLGSVFCLWSVLEFSNDNNNASTV